MLQVTGSGKTSQAMETGLVVNVPDFIEAGEYLEVNTAEGTYVRRATNDLLKQGQSQAFILVFL